MGRDGNDATRSRLRHVPGVNRGVEPRRRRLHTLHRVVELVPVRRDRPGLGEHRLGSSSTASASCGRAGVTNTARTLEAALHRARERTSKSRKRTTASPSIGPRVARWYICNADSERSTPIHCTSSDNAPCPPPASAAAPPPAPPSTRVVMSAARSPARAGTCGTSSAGHRRVDHAVEAPAVVDDPGQEPIAVLTTHADRGAGGDVVRQRVDGLPRLAGSPRASCAGSRVTPPRSWRCSRVEPVGDEEVQHRQLAGVVVVRELERHDVAGDRRQRLPSQHHVAGEVDDQLVVGADDARRVLRRST